MKKYLFSEFKKKIQNSDIKGAEIFAREIVAVDYPNSIKNTAIQFLNKIEKNEKNNYWNQAEYNFIVKLNVVEKEKLHPIVKEIRRLWLSEIGSNLNQENVDNDYLKYRENPLEKLKEIQSEFISQSISDCFNFNWYKINNPDLMKASDQEIIDHYLVYGKLELNRSPNKLVENSEIFVSYPWVRSYALNPLYLLIILPEVFQDIIEIIRMRYQILNNRKLSSVDKKFVTQRNIPIKNENNKFVRRVISITKKITKESRALIKNDSLLIIHFVVPDFTEGGGGHMTIFRLVKRLEEYGHKCTIWIKGYEGIRHPNGPLATIRKYYQEIKSKVLPLSSHYAFARGDALVATSWDTVECVLANRNFLDRFYLIQDYEPYFYPRGSDSLLASATYQTSLKKICASKWLQDITTNGSDENSIHFSLSFDRKYYFTKKNKEIKYNNLNLIDIEIKNNIQKPIIRIAFYARSRTERRAVSLALSGLALVHQAKFTLCVELFGETQGEVILPPGIVGFDNGILPAEKLAELYRNCDIGLTFSATNYALVPQEMMACGLTVIELDNDSTRAVYPEGVVYFVMPNPQHIAKGIEILSESAVLRQTISDTACKWVELTSWERSFDSVISFIQNSVKKVIENSNNLSSSEAFYSSIEHTILCESQVLNPLVSVIIPTFNGGSDLNQVIKAVLLQKTSFPYDVIIVDSSSTDGSIECLPDNPKISIFKINKELFQHGRTRNFAIAKSKANFAAFLTQDALPDGVFWLEKLVTPFNINPNLAATFGRHKGYDYHPTNIKKSIAEHFNQFEKEPLHNIFGSESIYFNKGSRRRQFLHYYSDNNSCLKKSVWIEYPYPDVEYGEDQLWADLIIQLGFSKLYVNDAVVFHSHFYTPIEEYQRAKIEAFFFLNYFDYNLGANWGEMVSNLAHEVSRILGKENSNNDTHVSELIFALRARTLGHCEGAVNADKYDDDSHIN